MDIASACLVGKRCRYDGQARENKKVKELYKSGKVKAVCPECLGGLKSPRCPSEIAKGEGEDVLEGRARVMAKDGRDRTAQFIDGARKTLEIAQELGAKRAYLKSKSPSCGYAKIYDGTFSGTLRQGKGVTGALLARNGIEIIEV